MLKENQSESGADVNTCICQRRFGITDSFSVSKL